MIDGDLFQGVLLGLLALGVIVLIALLATLGGIRKALEQRAVAATPVQPQLAGSPASAGASEEPQPIEEPHSSSPQTQEAVSAQPVTSGAGTGQADTIRSVLEQHGLQESSASTPAAAQPAAQEEPVVDSAFAAHADDPQEEPFQRDGRWWFRRGVELLLYDEASGQWQPAPADAAEAPSTVAAPAAATGTQTAATATATASMPVVADQVATFWKCATCGAVNGSTAATCRMCFAARP